MAMTVVRTAADELADVERAIRTARREMANWAAHVERMAAHPEDAEAIAMQARRSMKIAEALLDEAHVHTMAARMLEADGVSAGQ